MNVIRRNVRSMTKKHLTNDPFLIADSMNIIVIFRYMHHDINGFYKLEQRNRFIVINKHLSHEMQRFVCAHELAHAILHPTINTPFLRANTLLSVDKIEREANEFAVELLIPDELLHEGMNIYDAAAVCGVPNEVACLKKINNQSFWSDNTSFFPCDLSQSLNR